jgi:hypothetical protein
MNLLFILIPLSVFSQTLHMVVLGGSGEPQNKETTIFDAGLEKMGEFNRSHPDIKSQVFFNGGHAETEKIAAEGFGSSKPFTAQEYYRVIEDYKRKMNSGEIRPGEKILINLYTHGASKDPGETTHKIAAGSGAVTNFDSIAGTTTVSVDALKSLRDLAKAKGIQLAIIDLSCHSGNTLKLADENTCVISATGPNHYSGAGTKSFGAVFSGALSPGKTLEDAYLSARSQFNDPSFPMISSPAGEDVQERIYDNETPFLYYYNPQNDKLTPYLEKLTDEGGKCEIDQDLIGLSSEIEKVLRSGANPELTQKLGEMKAALNAYHDYLREIRRKMDQFGIGDMGKIHELCSGEVCQKYTAKEIVSTSFSAFIPYYEEKGDKDRAAIARQGEELKSKLLIENPKMKESAKFWATLPDLQKKSSLLQSNVAKAQKELYLEMYHRSQAKGPNPCRDFKL